MRELDITIKVDGDEAATRKLGTVDQAIDKVESSAKTAGGSLGTVDAELRKLGPSLDTATTKATSYAQKILQIGGATKLTADEQRKATEVLKAGTAEWERMGKQVPAIVQRVTGELLGLQSAEKAVAVESEAMASAQTVASGASSKLLGITGLLGGATLAAGAAFVAAVPVALSYASSLDKIATSSGAGVVGAQRLENIAARSGAEVRNLAQGASELARRVADGDKSALGALSRLGIATEQFIQLRADDKFISVASSLGRVADEGERAALAKDLFSNWQEVLPALTTDVGAFADSIHTMSEDEIKDLVQVQREWASLKLEVKRTITELVALAATPIKFIVQIVWTRPNLNSELNHMMAGDGIRPGRQTSIELPFQGANNVPNSPFGFAAETRGFVDPSAIGSLAIGGQTLEQQQELNRARIKADNDAIAAAKRWQTEWNAALADVREHWETFFRIAELSSIRLQTFPQYGALMGLPTDVPGLLQPGNIDLMHRPRVANEDGTISTVRSMSFEQDGKEILIPTVVGDRIVSNLEAIKHYQQTGQHLGMFDTTAHADAYAQMLHSQQAALLAGIPRLPSLIDRIPGTSARPQGLITLNAGTEFERQNLAKGPVDIKAAAAANIQAATTTKTFNGLSESVERLSASFSMLAQVSGPKFRGVAQDIGTIVTAMNLAKDAGKGMHGAIAQIGAGGLKNKIEGYADLAANAMAAAAAMQAATSSDSRARNVLGGAATGAQIGMQVGGPIGAGIGAAGGAIFGWLRSNTVESRTVSPVRDKNFADLATQLGGSAKNPLATISPMVQQATGSLKLVEDVLHSKTLDQYTEAWGALTGAIDKFKKSADDAYRSLDLVTGKLEHVTQISPEVREALDAAIHAKNPADFAAAMITVNSQLDATAQKHQRLKDLADKYGISLANMGKKFAQNEVDEHAKTLMDDFKDLIDGGADATAILHGMAGEYSKLVQEAKTSGTEIPLSMKPTLQKLIDMGELVDDNGKKLTDLDGLSFGDTLEQRLKDIKDVVKDLKSSIDDLALAFRGLPTALPSLPSVNTSPRSQVDTSGISNGPDAGGFSGPKDDVGNDYISHTGSIIRAGGLERFHTGGALLRKVGWSTLSQQLGLAGDERAIIGQVGEGILNRTAMANMAPQQFHALNRGVDPQAIFTAAQRGGVVGPRIAPPAAPPSRSDSDTREIVRAIEALIASQETRQGEETYRITAQSVREAVNKSGGILDIAIEKLARQQDGVDQKMRNALRVGKRS